MEKVGGRLDDLSVNHVLLAVGNCAYIIHSLTVMVKKCPCAKVVMCTINTKYRLFVAAATLCLHAIPPAHGKTVSGILRSDAAKENNGQYITRFLFHGRCVRHSSVTLLDWIHLD